MYWVDFGAAGGASEAVVGASLAAGCASKAVDGVALDCLALGILLVD